MRISSATFAICGESPINHCLIPQSGAECAATRWAPLLDRRIFAKDFAEDMAASRRNPKNASQSGPYPTLLSVLGGSLHTRNRLSCLLIWAIKCPGEQLNCSPGHFRL